MTENRKHTVGQQGSPAKQNQINLIVLPETEGPYIQWYEASVAQNYLIYVDIAFDKRSVSGVQISTCQS